MYTRCFRSPCIRDSEEMINPRVRIQKVSPVREAMADEATAASAKESSASETTAVSAIEPLADEATAASVKESSASEATAIPAIESSMDDTNDTEFFTEEAVQILPVVASTLPEDISNILENEHDSRNEDAPAEDNMAADEEAVSVAESGDPGDNTAVYAAEGGDPGDDTAVYAAEGGDPGDPEAYLEQLLTEGSEKDLLFMILIFLLKEELSVEDELPFIFLALLLAE